MNASCSPGVRISEWRSKHMSVLNHMDCGMPYSSAIVKLCDNLECGKQQS